MRARIAHIGFGGDARERPFIGDIAPNRGAAIGFVKDHRQRQRLPVKEDIHDLAVVNMAAGDLDP